MTNQSDNTKERLYDILTSENYSSSEEITVPEFDDNNFDWLEKLLKFLFGEGNSSNDFLSIGSIGALILKGILVCALFFTIYWIVKNSDNIKGWLQNISFKKSQPVSIQDYHPIYLAKSWEDLPEHTQIPNVVTQLLHKDDTLLAMSILYRGSLRWLNDNKKLTILPANTEMQCITHINNIQYMNNIDDHISHYIIQLIKYWIPIAYNDNTEINKSELIKISKQWNITLQTNQLHEIQ